MPNKYRPEFRCTRTELYSDPDCQGHHNLSAREGHYINADSEEEALATMAKNHPGETEFTANLFKTFDDQGMGNIGMKTEPQLIMHWWNIGKKTLDFKGKRFRIPIGSTNVTIDTFNQNMQDDEDIAIRVFNMVLGDKTLFRNHYGREFKINWH